MQGVTTALVAFVLVCMAWPHIVKNKPQFFAAAGLAMLIILVDCLAHMSGNANQVQADGQGMSGLARFCYIVIALLQFASFLLMVLSTGGQSLSELSADVGKTIDVVRRGGESETIIVPLKGEQPKPRERDFADQPAVVRDDSSIPLE